MHRQELLKLLQQYQTSFMDEAGFVVRGIRLITENKNIFERSQPMHVTGSAWVVNPDRTRVLLMHHAKLQKWFQPGGHADGDPDVLRVALTETAEESGIEPAHINLLSEAIFDVDMHWVPDTDSAPAHGHIDIRFLVEIDDKLPVPGNDESHQVGWVALYDVPRFNNSRSTHRMVEKTRAMRNIVTQHKIA